MIFRNAPIQFEEKIKMCYELEIDLYDVLEDTDVILASAMKHIDKCENNPNECKKTNMMDV